MTCDAMYCQTNGVAVETGTLGDGAPGIYIEGMTVTPGWVQCSGEGSPYVKIERNSDGRRYKVLIMCAAQKKPCTEGDSECKAGLIGSATSPR